MKIKLISLELKNFKGEKNRLINFGDFTEIEGKNGSGKTTAFDAFCWIFFGKDSTDRKVFGVQPLDSSNNIIHHIDTIVTATLSIDGATKTFKRTLKEKWQKQKGAAQQEYKGTETLYEIDDIPVKQKDYLEQIGQILDENNFKLLSNPLYFPNTEWKKQREILFDIIGDISEESVINYNSNLKDLTELLQGKKIDDFNEKVKFNIKKLKDKVNDIPARIDENNSNICNEDFAALEKEKLEIQKQIDTIDSQIADSSKVNEGKLKLQEELYTLKDKLGKLRNDALKNANKPLNDIELKISDTKYKIADFNSKILNNQETIENKNKTIKLANEEIEISKNRKQQLLNDYHKENEILFNFDKSLTDCPTCGRAYDIEKIEEIKVDAENKFDVVKNKTLAYICSKGKPLADDIKKLEEKIVNAENYIIETNKEIAELEKQKTELETKLTTLEYEKQKIDCAEPVIEGEKELLTQIESTQAEIDNFKANDNTLFLNQKKALQEQLSTIERTLGKQDTNIDLQKRINELMKEEKELNIQIADLENQQFLGAEFIRTKVELLESTINQKFKGEVKFKLFKNLNNGGLEECCIPLVNGVPYEDVNKAGKMNVGISILNTLCEHYNTYCPVFVDNSESYDEILGTQSQLITLRANKHQKELKVEVIK